ncbi:MAG: hypothetical protein ACLR4Z_00850 [Butyricicoccaceae bacterium]
MRSEIRIRALLEDALRILRGVRFASELGFAIEENTAAAMRRQLVRLSCVAAERVREG